MIALPPGETLGTTSVWELPTYPVALGIGCLADTVSRVCTGRRSVSIRAGKAARTLHVTEGASVGRVVTLLLALLVLDLRWVKKVRDCTNVRT